MQASRLTGQQANRLTGQQAKILIVVVALLAMFVSPVVAHEKFKIVGTVVKVHAEQLDVKGVDGSTYEMDMFDSAPVFRKNRKVPRTELKPGTKVTVNALGHDMFDLEVVEIHITD